jgi:hypothetical protein
MRIEFRRAESDDFDRDPTLAFGICKRTWVADLPGGQLWVWSRIAICDSLPANQGELGRVVPTPLDGPLRFPPGRTANVVFEFDDADQRAHRGEPVARYPTIGEIAAVAAIVFSDEEWRIANSPPDHPCECILEQLDHCRGVAFN